MAIEWKKILTEVDIIDEDNMSSDLDTKIPTQQSVKAYVDSHSTSSSSQQISHGRLTLESGVPVSSTDQTAKTILYYTPYVGNIIGLYSGTAWRDKTFSEIHIDLTETQSCTTVNGDATLTVADTSQLIIGMEISGTGIAGGTTVLSITDATHLEMDANATGDGTNNITFKIPASKVLDVFAYIDGSDAVKLVFGPLWTNTTTRATALTRTDGVPVLSGAYSIAGTSYAEGKLRWIGTIGATATAGQTEDSSTGRFVWNRYNKVLKSLRSYNTDTSWTLSGGVAAREYQNGTNQIRGKFVTGETLFFHISMNAYWSAINAGGYGVSQIALDSTSTALPDSGSTCTFYSPSGTVIMLLGPAHGNVTVAAGYHYFTQIEQQSVADATNYPGGGLYSHLHTLWEG